MTKDAVILEKRQVEPACKYDYSTYCSGDDGVGMG